MLYNFGSTHGVYAVYGSYNRARNKDWRYLLATFFAVVLLGSGVLFQQVFARVQNVDLNLPNINFSSSTGGPVIPTVQFQKSQAEKNNELKTPLEAWIAQQKGTDWAFYIKGIDNNLEVLVNETKPFQTASIYKLYLLAPLAKKVPVETWETKLLTSRTYADCVDAMLSVSDNPCAQAMVVKMGTTYLQQEAKAAGYKDMNFKLDYYTGTAKDTGSLLTNLYNSNGYDAKTREISLNAMAKVKKVEAIRRGCNGCSSVMNKIGEINAVKHDAGIVEKNGKKYAVVIFSSRASWNQLVDATKIISEQL